MKEIKDIDKEFTQEQYDKLVKDFRDVLELHTPSTSFTSLLKRVAEETK